MKKSQLRPLAKPEPSFWGIWAGVAMTVLALFFMASCTGVSVVHPNDITWTWRYDLLHISPDGTHVELLRREDRGPEIKYVMRVNGLCVEAFHFDGTSWWHYEAGLAAGGKWQERSQAFVNERIGEVIQYFLKKGAPKKAPQLAPGTRSS